MLPLLMRPKVILRVWRMETADWQKIEKQHPWTPKERIQIGSGKPLYKTEALLRLLGKPKS